MEEEIQKNDEIEQAEEQPLYVPRPKWQIWGAWLVLGIFVLYLIMYYTNIFRGGR